MGTILIGLAAIVIIVFAVPLAVLRAGIRRQEGAGSLTCQPPGLSAAIARRVCRMRSDMPGPARRRRPASRGQALTPSGKKESAS
jgi:hypothetical protein